MSLLAKINPYGVVISGLKNKVAFLEKELSIVGQDGNLYLKETSEPKFPSIPKEKILKYCDHSPIVQPIHNAIIREVTNAGWSIKPLFNSKCSKCGQTFDKILDSEKCKCGGEILKPNLEQKKKLENFIDNPHPDIDLYSIIRSALKWELSIDDYYLSLSYIRQNDKGKLFIMDEPQALCVENPLLIGKVKRGDHDWSYFCPICNILDEEYLSDSKGKCTKHRIELWETSYVLYSGSRVMRRYSKKEIIEGHFNRRLPDDYGTPIIQACINQIEAALNLDLLNRDTFEKGTLAKIFAFEGYTQEEVASLEQAISSMAEKRKSLGSKLFNLFLGNSKGKIEIHDVLSDPSKLQALEWHRYYRDMLLSNYGVTPVFAGTVESGKAGNNPMLQIDVMANTAKAWMRTISEPLNTVLLSALGITDWYFDFDEIEREDKKESALVQKLKAETVAIYKNSGFEVEIAEDGSINPILENYSKEHHENLEKQNEQEDSLFNYLSKALFNISKDYEGYLFQILEANAKDKASLTSEINSTITDASRKLDAELRNHIYLIFNQGYTKTYFDYSKLLSKEDINPLILKHLKEYFDIYSSPFFEKWEEREKENIFRILEEEILKGYNWQTVKKRLSDEYFERRDSYYWQTVARTEGARAFNFASEKAAKDLGATEKRFVFTEDGLACLSCVQASKEDWIGIDSETSYGNPPLHPNCRCYYEFRVGRITRKWNEIPAEKRPDFTDEMHDALWEYSSTSYFINTILRHPKDYLERITYKLQIERAKKAIETLRKIFNLPESVIREEGVVLWRGLSEKDIITNMLSPEDPDLKGIFEDKGFSSTSKDSSIALAFGYHYMSSDDDYVTLLKINIPKGTKVIYVGNSYGYAQEEVILINGSMFHINGSTVRDLTESEKELLYNEGFDPQNQRNIKVKIYDVNYLGDANS